MSLGVPASVSCSIGICIRVRSFSWFVIEFAFDVMANKTRRKEAVCFRNLVEKYGLQIEVWHFD